MPVVKVFSRLCTKCNKRFFPEAKIIGNQWGMYKHNKKKIRTNRNECDPCKEKRYIEQGIKLTKQKYITEFNYMIQIKHWSKG